MLYLEQMIIVVDLVVIYGREYVHVENIVVCWLVDIVVNLVFWQHNLE